MRDGRSCTSTCRAFLSSVRAMAAVGIQEGVPGGGFLVKNSCPSGPSGYLRKDTGRLWRWRRITSAVVA